MWKMQIEPIGLNTNSKEHTRLYPGNIFSFLDGNFYILRNPIQYLSCYDYHFRARHFYKI